MNVQFSHVVIAILIAVAGYGVTLLSALLGKAVLDQPGNKGCLPGLVLIPLAVIAAIAAKLGAIAAIVLFIAWLLKLIGVFG